MTSITDTYADPRLRLECSPDEKTLVAAFPSGRERDIVTATTNPVTGGSIYSFGDEAIPAAYATKTYRAYADAIANHATSTYNCIGYDVVDNVVFVNDQTGGMLRQGSTTTTWETQAAVTFSTAKGWPTGVTHTDVKRILRFKNKLYLLAKDTADGVTKLWRASPVSGNTVFTWEGPVISYPEAVSKGIQTALTCDDQYIYLAEYGDPTGGPSAWRSDDGLTWTVCYAKDPNIRHIHAIEADPYNPGHLWMTVGDGVAYPVKRSKDYGATWINCSTIKSAWQAVQISFTKHYVYLAGDSQQGVVAVVNRDNEIPRWVSVGLLKNLPVPAPSALTDTWFNNAYYGIVDPNSGVFYSSANDSSVPGNVAGLFCTLGFGQTPMLLDKFTSIQGAMYIFGGMVWCGKYRRPLL